MIYIVEIPGQGKARCWSALDEKDAIDRMYQAFVRRGDTPEDGSFADWCEYNGSDLYAQRVYMTAEDAINGLSEISGHGAYAAIDALRERLIRDGEIEENKV